MIYFLAFTLSIFLSLLFGFSRRTSNVDWMSRDFTTAIKGFAILTVVWAHTGARLGVGGIQFIAGIGVALFLICSGYGLEVSYEKQGLNGFLKKRLLKVCVPFWIVELIGLIATGEFTVKGYILDALFIKQATGYGWFMQYIVICYIIFFAVKKLMEQTGFIRNHELAVIFTVFVAWFVIDSLFFVSSSMPFLRARQMLCFPTGMVIAKNKEQIEERVSTVSLLKLGGGILIATFLMAITQTGAVKAMPYLVSNLLSLGTCFVYALVVLVVGLWVPILFQSKLFSAIGIVSYEIYLTHVFLLRVIALEPVTILIFVIGVTISTLLLSSFTRQIKV